MHKPVPTEVGHGAQTSLKNAAIAPWLRAIVLSTIVAGLCLNTLTRSGYLLLLDNATGPRVPPRVWDFSTPFALLQELGVRTIGGGATARLYLFATLFLCGFAPMVLLRGLPWFAQVPAGLLGALNPWVYDRLVEGQWSVVAAAALLFLWLAAWRTLQREPGWRSLARWVACGVAIAVASRDFIGLVAVLSVAGCFAARVWQDRRRLRWTAMAVAALGVALSYGLIPFFTQKGLGTYAMATSFGRADFQAFQATSDPHVGLWMNLIGFKGYWAESLGRFAPADGGAPWWPVSALLLAALAVAGAWLRPESRWLLAVGVLGLLVAGSTATGPGLSVVLFLSSHVPLVGGYRDPTKWSALWLLAVVTLSAEGVAVLGSGGLAGRRVPATGAIAAVVMALATLLPSGRAQIVEMPSAVVPIDYPADWYQAAAYLDSHATPGDTVVLMPWHLYAQQPFTRGIVLNPGPVFFPGDLISPNDPELPGETAVVASPHDIGRLALAAGDNPDASCSLAAAIRAAGAHWVVVEAGVIGARATAEELLRCGFHTAEGSPGVDTAVLTT